MIEYFKLMGLDYGRKRIGVALSDEMRIIAQGWGVIENHSTEESIKKIAELAVSSKVQKIIVGNPINMNGTRGEKAIETEAFVEKLKGSVNVPIELCDERLSTRVAEKVLIQGGVSRKKRKKINDKIAAQLILQNYLDSLENEND